MEISFPRTPLPATRLDERDPIALRSIAAICRESGLGMQLRYNDRPFRYPVAASFISRGAGAARH